MVKLTPELSRSTGIDQKVKALQSHENPDVRALSKVIAQARGLRSSPKSASAGSSSQSPGPSLRARARLVARRVGGATVRTPVCEGLRVCSQHGLRPSVSRGRWGGDPPLRGGIPELRSGIPKFSSAPWLVLVEG